MSTDPRKRQKKQERRVAKRKEKKHLQARQQSPSLSARLSAAVRHPVLDCGIAESLDDQGIGWVVLSRALPNGQVAVASFLVDRYCLGVKDTHAEVLGRSSYESKYARKFRTEMPVRRVSPAEAYKFLHDAVAYARSLGLPPHADYPKTLLLFGDVDPAESSAEFEFGKDGKPYFISGPHDTPERCRQIMAILTNTCGVGQFHYLVQAAGPQDLRKFLPDALRGEPTRLIGSDGTDEWIDGEVDGSEEDE